MTGLDPEERPRPRGRFRAFRRDERGTALVEFALIAPLLFLLLFGIIDFGRALNYYNQVAQLAGQGARAAAVNRMPNGGSIPTSPATAFQSQLAADAAQPELRAGVVVCIVGPLPTNLGDPVTVKVSYQFHFLPLISAAAKALGGAVTLSDTQTERAEVVPASYSAGDQTGGNCS